MTPFLGYMVKVGAALILFYGFYELLLKKETYFHLNRIYLVSALFLSFLLPAVPLASPFRTIPVPAAFAWVPSGPPPVRSSDPADLLPLIYAAGAFLFLVRLAAHLIRLLGVVRRNGVRRAGPVRLVAVERDFSPFSFFGFVFINLNDRRVAESDLRRILAHEQVHVRQGHSFDVLLMELVIILQWFNPFVRPYKKALRETHEYLADSGVMAQGFSPAKYRRLVFEQHVGAAMFEFGNNFKQSQMTRRIAMMSKNQSGKASRLKLLLALPLVLGLVLAFAEPKAAVSASPTAPPGQTESVSKAWVEQTFDEIKKLEHVLKALTQKIETAADEKSKQEGRIARAETIKKLERLKASLDGSAAASLGMTPAADLELRKIREREAVIQAELETVREESARAELEKKLRLIHEKRESLTAIREESGAAQATIKAKELWEKEAALREERDKTRTDDARIEYKKRLAEIRERREQIQAELVRSKTRDTTEASEATAKYKELLEKEAAFRGQRENVREAAAKDEYSRMLKTDQERRDRLAAEIHERQASRLARADEATAAYQERLEKEKIHTAKVSDEFRKVREEDSNTALEITAAGLKKIIAALTDEELAVRSKMGRTEDEKLRRELQAQLVGILNKIEAAKAEYLKLKSEKI